MNRLSRVIFISIILSLSTLRYLHSALAQIPPIERAALIALYDSTDGDNWGNIETFLKKRDLPGGTGTIAVANALEEAKKIVDELL